MSKWISVDDRLPMDNTMCQVRTTISASHYPTETYRYVRESDGDYFWDNLLTDILQSNEVTHWMPLPDPPK